MRSGAHRCLGLGSLVAMPVVLMAFTVSTANAVVPNCPIPPPRGAAAAKDRLARVAPNVTLPPLHASGQFLVDPNGHPFIPHGVNAVYKCYPYYPDATQLTTEDVQAVRYQ